MPEFSSTQKTALANDRIAMRTFLWVEATNPDTGESDPAGFWSDVGVVTLGERDYAGAGIMGGAEIIAAAPFTIPSLNLTLNGVSDDIVNLIRAQKISQAPVTYSWALFDPDTRAVIGGLVDAFIGWIDDVEIKTPKVGDKSNILVTCESLMRALTIKSTDVRSNESQILRSTGDGFFKHADVQRENHIYFGRAKPKAA